MLKGEKREKREEERKYLFNDVVNTCRLYIYMLLMRYFVAYC